MAKSKKFKKNNDDVVWANLKGFCRKGAVESSLENVPTGHFRLDFAIQYGQDASKTDLSKLEGYDPSITLGIPLGKLVEIFGEEGSGKSSLAYRISGYAQKMGLPVGWIDCEHSFQENLAHINGCDPNDLAYSNLIDSEDPDKDLYAEDVIDYMIKMMKSGIKIIVLDSVANLVPKALFEAKSEQQFMGLLPRLMSSNLGKLVGHAEKNGSTLVFINQLREKINVTYGDNETSPGGHSLKHNASLRLKVTKRKGKDADIYIYNPETGEPMLIGRHSMVKIVKNRFAKPFLEPIDIPIYYEPYFPDIEDIAFDTGRQIKLISVLKGEFKWGNMENRLNRIDFIDYVKSNNLLGSLIKDIKEKSAEKNVILPPELMQYGLSAKNDGSSK
jgi:recombination protein RecA